MFTRCPECHDVHPLGAASLAAAAGQVRCGHCKHEFNALACLFDHWPDFHSSPPNCNHESAVPELGSKDTVAGGGTNVQDQEPGQKPGDPNRIAWVAVFVLLLAITASNLAWTFREPLLANVKVREMLIAAGWMERETEIPFRDLQLLHLVSRDMHKHPTRSGILSLSVVFVNRAAQAQAYPVLEVTLTDAGGLGLARREFSSADYLPFAATIDGLLAPNVHVPVLLEFADPGDQAVGFELRFR